MEADGRSGMWYEALCHYNGAVNIVMIFLVK